MTLQISIVGRTNVGKSTLFNYLTKGRTALVLDTKVTRDRQYKKGKILSEDYIVIDTGGFSTEKSDIDTLVNKQAWQAVFESDVVLFVVDAEGLSALDEILAGKLRKKHKSIYLVINKADNLDYSLISDFAHLGFKNMYPISALFGKGVKTLLSDIFKSHTSSTSLLEKEEGIKVVFLGRPNVGKSTLINTILKENRVIAWEEAGTTVDSIFIPFKKNNKKYVLIDTAGIRRKPKITKKIEKFSVIKTKQALRVSDVAVLIIDATEIAEQDLRLFSLIQSEGKPLLIAINKWDLIAKTDRTITSERLEHKLKFQDSKLHFISSLKNEGIRALFSGIDKLYKFANMRFSTPKLNKILKEATLDYPPPLVRGRRIKLRYVHVAEHNPLVIIIHGTQTDSTPISYVKYLEKTFQKELDLESIPIKIKFIKTKNPYASKKNTLNKRQIKKRQRVMKYAKK